MLQAYLANALFNIFQHYYSSIRSKFKELGRHAREIHIFKVVFNDVHVQS